MTNQEHLDKVREEIAKILKPYIKDEPWKLEVIFEVTSRILAIPEIAVLDTDQSLPLNLVKQWAYSQAQEDMLAQGFRRMIER